MTVTASTEQRSWHFDAIPYQVQQMLAAGLDQQEIIALKASGLDPAGLDPVDPRDKLPTEIFFMILSNLRGTDLAACCLVSKTWKQLASSDSLWREIVAREIAFGQEKWNEYFGDVGIAPPLPLNILEILKSACPIWEGKKVGDTHMLVLLPKTVDGQLLTLNSLEKLVKSPKKGNATCYRDFGNAAREEHGDKAIGASYWMLMTKDVLPGSRDKSYSDQKALVGGLSKKGQASYEVPKLLEAACSIFIAYVASGKRLFSDDPWIYTRCQEQTSGCQMAVGGFAPAGLFVLSSLYAHDNIGVAGLRKVRRSRTEKF